MSKATSKPPDKTDKKPTAKQSLITIALLAEIHKQLNEERK